jgi:hypothetical protein
MRLSRAILYTGTQEETGHNSPGNGEYRVCARLFVRRCEQTGYGYRLPERGCVTTAQATVGDDCIGDD